MYNTDALSLIVRFVMEIKTKTWKPGHFSQSRQKEFHRSECCLHAAPAFDYSWHLWGVTTFLVVKQLLHQECLPLRDWYWLCHFNITKTVLCTCYPLMQKTKNCLF